MPQGKPQPGEVYLHFKGKRYQVIATAVHSETGEKLVIYQALYGTYGVYARPYDMFISPVDHNKYPTVEQYYRFRLLTPDEIALGEAAEFFDEPHPFGSGPAAAAAETFFDSAAGTKKAAPMNEAAQANQAAGADETVPMSEAAQANQAAGADEAAPMSEYFEINRTTEPDKAADGDETTRSDGKEAADPWLIRYMDADTFEEKVQVFSDMRPYITDRLIDEIAMVSDLAIDDGPLEQRYLELKNCLEMRMRFEGSRIRD